MVLWYGEGVHPLEQDLVDEARVSILSDAGPDVSASKEVVDGGIGPGTDALFYSIPLCTLGMGLVPVAALTALVNSRTNLGRFEYAVIDEQQTSLRWSFSVPADHAEPSDDVLVADYGRGLVDECREYLGLVDSGHSGEFDCRSPDEVEAMIDRLALQYGMEKDQDSAGSDLVRWHTFAQPPILLGINSYAGKVVEFHSSLYAEIPVQLDTAAELGVLNEQLQHPCVSFCMDSDSRDSETGIYLRASLVGTAIRPELLDQYLRSAATLSSSFHQSRGFGAAGFTTSYDQLFGGSRQSAPRAPDQEPITSVSNEGLAELSAALEAALERLDQTQRDGVLAVLTQEKPVTSELNHSHSLQQIGEALKLALRLLDDGDRSYVLSLLPGS